ncbi:MAG TPA: hydrolase [Clostridium sp.]|jgi:L-ascorbate metabolism protein UlaG (beta-lactamase superfamily)|uniref:MBL fold metallo-hydrolase n=1 Tax=Clostridium lapidicellarium TaxID=3240931 RepID=A0ABV4DSY8_9CLOT|nr:MBL fold metallo-hydrolase [uncultured Clostridium sp.]NLU07994.1 MBL fold metallo-hydrolase [Clostridiales bacterium]HBC95877.1 hydrolase [Clostridium sp.]
MKNYNIKIHYLYHSSFAVETPSHFLIFDYYMDSFDSHKHTLENGLISEDLIRDKKNLLVFCSHRHPDHFNPIILKWQKVNPETRYILSSDIKIRKPPKNYYRLSRYESLDLGDIYIKAYGSTDVGISFLIKLDGITVFHAGDLNLWQWKEDSNGEQISAEKNFKMEVGKIKGEKIDFAFFPVDPRLEERYSLGGKYFIDQIHPKFFIPMHFWDNTYITGDFAELLKHSSTKCLTIDHRGQTFDFS